jgi:hypothetical protein
MGRETRATLTIAPVWIGRRDDLHAVRNQADPHGSSILSEKLITVLSDEIECERHEHERGE